MALHLGAWARAGTVGHGCPLASAPQATGRRCRWSYVEYCSVRLRSCAHHKPDRRMNVRIKDIFSCAHDGV